MRWARRSNLDGSQVRGRWDRRKVITSLQDPAGALILGAREVPAAVAIWSRRVEPSYEMGVTESRGIQRLAHYLAHARAMEVALTRSLGAHIATAPAGEYRRALERHLGETHEHARRLDQRANQLGYSRPLIELGVGTMEALAVRAAALASIPLELLRRPSLEQKLVQNATQGCAAEALEIATYDTIEELARALGDERTAELAASIRAEEERALKELRRVIPTLVAELVSAELGGLKGYDPTSTRPAREERQRADDGADGDAGSGADGHAGSGVDGGADRAAADGVGSDPSSEDLAIADYDRLTAQEIIARLPELAQSELAALETYERLNQSRKTVLEGIDGLRAQEPWPGYDGLTVQEIRKALSAAERTTGERVRDYERRHKQRQGVLEVTANRPE